jgi:L-aspartate oxidase
MLADAGVSMGTELIPVAPAAHYYMGGVIADSRGRTSKPGLLAIGEVACTGVHGANRLASNSLLEGLVFGINASDALENSGLPALRAVEQPEAPSTGPVPDTAESRKNIRRRMTEWVGVVRNREDMLKALAYITDTPDIPPVIDREALISRNMRLVSKLVALSALDRDESRGGHIRTDFPETDPDLDNQHQLVSSFMAGGDRDVVRWFGELHANWPWESV